MVMQPGTMLVFAATVMPLVCTPGPDILFVSHHKGCQGGTTAAMRANLGAYCSGTRCTPFLPLSVWLPLSPRSPVLFEILRWVGVRLFERTRRSDRKFTSSAAPGLLVSLTQSAGQRSDGRQPALRTIDRRYWGAALWLAAGRKKQWGLIWKAVGSAAAASHFSPDDARAILQCAAAVFPDRTAVIHGDIRYSWREHDLRCRLLASGLRRSGVGTGRQTVAARRIRRRCQRISGVPTFGQS